MCPVSGSWYKLPGSKTNLSMPTKNKTDETRLGVEKHIQFGFVPKDPGGHNGSSVGIQAVTSITTIPMTFSPQSQPCCPIYPRLPPHISNYQALGTCDQLNAMSKQANLSRKRRAQKVSCGSILPLCHPRTVGHAPREHWSKKINGMRAHPYTAIHAATHAPTAHPRRTRPPICPPKTSTHIRFTLELCFMSCCWQHLGMCHWTWVRTCSRSCYGWPQSSRN